MFTLSLLFLCNMVLEKIALSKLFLQSVQLFLSRAVDIAFYGTSKINLLSSALCLRLHIPSKLKYILDLLIQKLYGEKKYSKNNCKVDISDELYFYCKCLYGVKVNPSWLGLSKQSFKRYSNIQGLQLLF